MIKRKLFDKSQPTIAGKAKHKIHLKRINNMSNNIDGKVVVITGASSGLGEAAAKHLAGQGAIVVLGARRIDRIQAMADEINGKGGKALAVATDVMRVEQVKAL